MGYLTGFANVCKRHGGKFSATALLLLSSMMFVPATPAQYIGNVGQASTQSPFTSDAGAFQVLIPTCTTGGQTNCLKMIGQVSHQVIATYAGSVGHPCEVLLDGSLDGVLYQTLSSLYFSGPAATESMVANGNYPNLRLKINPGGLSTCAALNGTYTGFQTPLPVSSIATPIHQVASAIAQVNTAVTLNTPYLIAGVQCFNPNGGTAYLQLFDAAASPTLGTAYFYEIGIPAGAVFNFPLGSSLLGKTILWMGAATAAGGSTAVGTAVDCNFQMNYWGPFAPLNPVSP